MCECIRIGVCYNERDGVVQTTNYKLQTTNIHYTSSSEYLEMLWVHMCIYVLYTLVCMVFLF